MTRSALSFFASLFIFAATTFATEPFTVFEGKDPSPLSSPRHAFLPMVLFMLRLGWATRFTIAISKGKNAQFPRLPFAYQTCRWGFDVVHVLHKRGQLLW